MKQVVSMLKLGLANPLSMGCLVEQILKLPVHAVHTPRSLQALTILVYQTAPTGRTWNSRNQAEGCIKLSVRGLLFR